MSDGPAPNPPEDGGSRAPGGTSGHAAGGSGQPTGEGPGPWPPPGQGASPWPPPGQGASPWPPPGQASGPWPPPGQASGPWPPPGQQSAGWPPPNPPGYGGPGYGGYGPQGYAPQGYGGYGSAGYGGYGAPWPPPAPKPGVIPLRPIGLGEIIDGSITTIRRFPKATLGFTAGVMAISTAISTAVALGELPSLQRLSARASAGQNPTSADIAPAVGWLVTYGVVTLLLGLAVSVILTGTLTAVVGRAVLGQQTTVRQAWEQARGRIGALIGLTFLILAIFAGLWLVAIGLPIAALVTIGTAGVVLAVVGFIAVIPLTVFFWVKVSLAPAAVVLERVSPAAAIGRSWRLTRGSFWRVFGIWIVAYLVILVASLAIEVPFRLIADLLTGTGGFSFTAPPASVSGAKLVTSILIAAVGGLVAATVTRPIIAGVAALLYIDLRMRREGLDIALQTAAGRELATDDEFISVWRTPEPGSWGPGTGFGAGQGPGTWGPGPWEPGHAGPGAPPGQGAGPGAPPGQGAGPGAPPGQGAEPPGQGTPPW
jgi:hypothetical protein